MGCYDRTFNQSINRLFPGIISAALTALIPAANKHPSSSNFAATVNVATAEIPADVDVPCQSRPTLQVLVGSYVMSSRKRKPINTLTTPCNTPYDPTPLSTHPPNTHSTLPLNTLSHPTLPTHPPNTHTLTPPPPLTPTPSHPPTLARGSLSPSRKGPGPGPGQGQSSSLMAGQSTFFGRNDDFDADGEEDGIVLGGHRYVSVYVHGLNLGAHVLVLLSSHIIAHHNTS